MGRLMPGRIRNEGLALLEAGLLTLKEEAEACLTFEVDKNRVVYGAQEDQVSCTCQDFKRKDYCPHLAAVEAYFKQDPQGRDLAVSLEEAQKPVKDKGQEYAFGSLFLDGLQFEADRSLRYRLSAQGEGNPYKNQIWWTLKISRVPDQRSYVIRDIRAFLTTVKKESYFQIGKNYYEPLSLSQFDEASQALLAFLWKLVPEGEKWELQSLLPEQHRYLSLPAGFFQEGLALLGRLSDVRLELGHQSLSELRFKDLEAGDGLFSFDVLVHRRSIELIVREKEVQSFFGHTYLYYLGTFYGLTSKQAKIFQAIRSLPLESDLARHVQFDLEDQAKLAASLLDFKELGPVHAPKQFEIHDFEVLLSLDRQDSQTLTLALTFNYGKLRVSSSEEMNQLPFTSHFKKEASLVRNLKALGFGPGFRSQRFMAHQEDWYAFFTEDLPVLRRLGQVNLSPALAQYYQVTRPGLSVSRQAGLLDISFDFSGIAQEDVDHALNALLANEDYFVSQTGQILVFDDDTRKVAQVLQDLRARRRGPGQLSINQLAVHQLSQALVDRDDVAFSQDFEQMVYDLGHPEAFTLEELTVQARLREYQYLGVQWFSMLDHYGFGGLLADDMGLGKTLQTIAFLKSRLKEGQRALILAPSSLIYNWQDEFHKFAPDLDVLVSYGNREERDRLIGQEPAIMVTSYASFRQDFDLYQQGSYDYLILDEAQVMKNSQTKIAQALRDFNVKRCFALSGTPIENRLLEIWSIFQIILPGLLPPKKAFLKLSAAQVARYIKPFILRRKKEEVLPELPDLIEMTYPNELVPEQKTIYLAQLKQMQDTIRQSSREEFNRRKVEILSGITRLRQICNSPQLFMDYEGGSGKRESLRELLVQIKDNDHRVLIFSQFKGMLELVEEDLADLGLTSYKITGSTPSDDRQEMTKAFNKGSRDAFLISLKAGGVGLNLTGADTVILIDLWWNPAVEMQAISRAHRLGQKQKVEVFRLISKGTIEEKILELQESKKALVTSVLDGQDSRSSLSLEDIQMILGMTD